MEKLYIITSWKLLYNNKLLLSNIDSLPEAETFRDYFSSTLSHNDTSNFQILPCTPTKASDNFIRFYSENITNPEFKKLKIISGKNLALKAHFKGDNRYAPESFERNGNINFNGVRLRTTGNRRLRSLKTGKLLLIPIVSKTPTNDNYKGIYYFRSMERNKGISTIHKLKDSKKKRGGNDSFDIETYKAISEANGPQLKLSLTPTEYLERVRDNFTKFRDLFKHIKAKYSLSNKETRLLLQTT